MPRSPSESDFAYQASVASATSARMEATTFRRERQDPEQGSEQPSPDLPYEPSTFDGLRRLDLSAIQPQRKAEKKKSPPRRPRARAGGVISKSFDQGRKDSCRQHYTIKVTEIRENAGLRRCASQGTKVGLRLKAPSQRKRRTNSQAVVAPPVTIEPAARPSQRDCAWKAGTRIIVRKSSMYRYAARKQSAAAQARPSAPGGPLYVEDLAVRLRAEFYNRVPAREGLSQIKYNFKYQRAETFDLGTTCFVMQKMVVRNQDHCLEGTQCLGKEFPKGVLMLLKPLHVLARAEYLAFIRQQTRLSSSSLHCDLAGEEHLEELENSQCNAGNALDNSYDQDARRKMTEEIKDSWYNTPVQNHAQELMEENSLECTLLAYEGTRYGWRDLLKCGRTLTDRKPRKRRPSKRQFILSLDVPENSKDRSTISAANLSEETGCDCGVEKQVRSPTKNSYKGELKTRANEILRDLVPLDMAAIMKKTNGSRSETKTQSGEYRIRPKMRGGFTSSDVAARIKKAMLDTVAEDYGTQEDPSLELGELLAHRQAAAFRGADATTCPKIELQPEINMLKEASWMAYQQRDQVDMRRKISDKFRRTLIESMDSYTTLVGLEAYNNESDMARERERQITEATDLLTENSMVPYNAGIMMSNERLASPFIMDGCGLGEQANVMKRHYAVKHEGEEEEEGHKETNMSLSVLAKLRLKCAVGYLQGSESKCEEGHGGADCHRAEAKTLLAG